MQTLTRHILTIKLAISLNTWKAQRELSELIETISREQFNQLFNESSADLFELISSIPEGMRKERLIAMYAHESLCFDQCKTVTDPEGHCPLNGKRVVVQETPAQANIGATKCWYIREDGEPDYDYTNVKNIS